MLTREPVQPSEATELRPVLLTAITTIAGLMPMVLALTIDFVGRDVYFGAPSTQYRVQLSTVIVGGLFTATALAVLVTPGMLVWFDSRFARRAEAAADTPKPVGAGVSADTFSPAPGTSR
jgi:multidrug efflux pump